MLITVLMSNFWKNLLFINANFIPKPVVLHIY